MARLPIGTVTFVFTDIEGSTRLLQDLGDGYRAVQVRHDTILRRAFSQAGGTVVRTQGDSFFAVFSSPTAALRAAVAAQRELGSENWPHGRPLRVRMGLHTGEGMAGGGDYLGVDVNRAARISDAAWGGQILLSLATKVLVESALPHGVFIRSLGVHRLKDLLGSEHLFDVVIPGLVADFPSPRTLEVPSNLPAQLTSFVGRDAEVAAVKTLLAGTRLLTLTGAGGTGKTRLALRVAEEVARDFPDGTFFVDLAPVSEPGLVISTIAAALGVREEGWERPVRDAVEDYLRDRRLLLLLDNFEQVLDAATLVPELLARTPSLKIMVTSRASLRVRGEQVVPIPPLEVPVPGEGLGFKNVSHIEAVTLFTQRAAAVAPISH